MHIMHLIESLEFGGAEKVVVHLANKLSEYFQVSICLTKRKGSLVEQLNPEIQVHFLDSGEGNDYSLPGKIETLMRDHNVDILHSHDWGVYLEAAFAIRNLPNSKLIHTVHGKYTQFDSRLISKFKVYLRHFLERLAVKNTYRIIAVSESIKDYIIKDIRLPISKVETIHNGIAALNSNSNKPINLHDRLNLITVGRIAAIKNYKLLIQALALAVAENPDIYLVFVGDGPEMKSVQELTETTGIQHHVKFLGFRTDVEELLLKSDVFVLSSNYEGVSIAILEAMSIGMPVISTSVGGVPETVVDNVTGYLVNPGDVLAYKDAILKLDNERMTLNEMGKAGQSHFYQLFHEDIVIEKYKILYENSLKE